MAFDAALDAPRAQAADMTSPTLTAAAAATAAGAALLGLPGASTLAAARQVWA
jgi:hypothetical protein